VLVSEIEFLTRRFQSYYEKNTVSGPPGVSFREFGTGDFGKKIARRHLSFANSEQFNSFLRHQVPFFVSYSSAYYRFPANRPMDAKEWLHSDIVYEFDSDDLKTDCKQEHDSWQCKSCGTGGAGFVSACANCGSSAIAVSQWVCPECLRAAKKELLRLLFVLEHDFGFHSDFAFNFSGSKGFHIHLRGEEVQNLSPKARIELLDFITGTNLDFESIGFVSKTGSLASVPLAQARGWNKKILLGVRDLILQSDAEALSVAGSVSTGMAQKVFAEREHVLESLSRGTFPLTLGKKSNGFWRSILDFVSDQNRLAVDRQTSLDKFKIIRVPNTIHGETGLLARSFAREALESFDPLNESVVFSDKPVSVLVKKSPKFFLSNQWFGPFESVETDLPEYAALFLLARGAATLPENGAHK